MESAGAMVAQTIQLALTPVFVLVAIGSIMNILSICLGRTVDRSRILQEEFCHSSGAKHDGIVREIRSLDRRIVLINRALLLLVLSAISIGLVVVILFLEEFAGFDLQVISAIGFIVSVVFMMLALGLFLMETRVATRALRIPTSYLELDRDL